MKKSKNLLKLLKNLVLTLNCPKYTTIQSLGGIFMKYLTVDGDVAGEGEVRRGGFGSTGR